MRRESHHMALLERFAPDAPTPESDDPVVRMAHRLNTKKGRALYGLRKARAVLLWHALAHNPKRMMALNFAFAV